MPSKKQLLTGNVGTSQHGSEDDRGEAEECEELDELKLVLGEDSSLTSRLLARICAAAARRLAETAPRSLGALWRAELDTRRLRESPDRAQRKRSEPAEVRAGSAAACAEPLTKDLARVNIA